MRVNLTGCFLVAQAAARVMVRQGGGTIVNLGSISGQRGSALRAAYGASKAGVMQLTPGHQRPVERTRRRRRELDRQFARKVRKTRSPIGRRCTISRPAKTARC